MPHTPGETRELGRTGVCVPPLGLGGAPLGDDAGPGAEERAAAVVEAAFATGCGYLDTAPHYGAGVSEERLGRALAGRDRRSYVLSTKVGRRLGGTGAHRTRVWDLSGDGIRATLEDSLLRLGTDRVDVLLLHDVDHHVREVYETGFPALAKLREEKVVRAIGFGMNDAAGLARFVADLDVDVVLCAGKYTLLDTSAHDELLPLCERRGTAVVLGGVYNSGLLADPRPGASYDYREAPPALVDRARRLAAVCTEFGVPLQAAALRFGFGHPAVAAAVVGARTPEEVRQNAAHFARPVPYEMWSALVERGLLPPGLPLPAGTGG
ncbi:aldo/keto reductase [Streptomyces sp. NBC_01808]|uniref:aldo/keto reductase n=1 Tax=Streptomyces sp. NBC_01808 TaxID=2975947 RepID=UPI002DD98DD1|nr:aldo/keto reductase [Streptomyces sp. NBC_01808]WSA35979.1 aldo/keto reductase [Streptomyces sp. NBC_01808]